MFWIIEHLAIATGAMVILGIGLVVLIFLLLNRIYPHESTRPLFGSALVSILVTVLFPVIVNNWYAIKRDRDNRLRTLRDQHFAQLRPVLRSESTKLQELASQVVRQAHVTAVGHIGDASLDPRDTLWPDVMSSDLQHHFPGYDKAKRDLLSEINLEDDEFRATLSTLEEQLKPIKDLDPQWRGIAAMSFVERCISRGDGMTLRITGGGYDFSYWGASIGASGGGASPPKPSPDQVAAFNAFQSVKPNAELTSHCQSLKNRAESIIHSAQELSREAQLDSETAILKGDCEFLKSGNLAD